MDPKLYFKNNDCDGKLSLKIFNHIVPKMEAGEQNGIMSFWAIRANIFSRTGKYMVGSLVVPLAVTSSRTRTSRIGVFANEIANRMEAASVLCGEASCGVMIEMFSAGLLKPIGKIEVPQGMLMDLSEKNTHEKCTINPSHIVEYQLGAAGSLHICPVGVASSKNPTHAVKLVVNIGGHRHAFPLICANERQTRAICSEMNTVRIGGGIRISEGATISDTGIVVITLMSHITTEDFCLAPGHQLIIGPKSVPAGLLLHLYNAKGLFSWQFLSEVSNAECLKSSTDQWKLVRDLIGSTDLQNSVLEGVDLKRYEQWGGLDASSVHLAKEFGLFPKDEQYRKRMEAAAKDKSWEGVA